ncbi:hypothetical protein Tco_1062661 [Tanacetum coccineum]
MTCSLFRCRISDRFLGGFIVNVELAAAFENRGLVPFALKEYQWLSPINCHLGETLEEAAVAAAYKVAEAENKSFVAAEAVKELERVTRMAEEAEAFLQLVQQIYERCATGEVVKVQ